ncbi:hypothetical protein CUC08_Gglean002805 [Alternaria sp. MG1]|uniref:Uncharacterized protein n=2 Tax=Alternaria alternata complex TaxID=187734 RepID=A0A4Q4NE49_ALTAL|nr:uncharacterized protein J4E82_004065 [Alternaria postmessia]RII16367.1 hypothetical protein CUC08_Gglean002805 [Alternaria sp. MG1]RYN47973.1 hypothetical protein AA0114_g7367 [Alternaria tenuissima]RYN73826.1 hypothetical protein AA0117_g7415 [Alternaria alternata]KAI5377272.1 hypothetical protein J4E82_004065 [Alternaria postmessia]RYN57846.1 hypothetical protein AA0118_g7456 [Alternaria tenuissima]
MVNDPKASDAGRETPLPQYEKTQSVPFTLNLQEDARNPGQFQLVFNLGSKQQLTNGVPLNCTPHITSPMIPRSGLKSDAEHSVVISPQKTSPPTTPLHDKQGWADLENVPPDFLRKVVPDWNVSFSRSDSTASVQSKRLTDIKARIKKKGKGYVVRLLKGSTDSNEIAEVELGQRANAEQTSETQELDSATLPAELYCPPSAVISTTDMLHARNDVFEIGTSNSPGIQRPLPSTVTESVEPAASSMEYPPRHSLARSSIAEDGMSDAETLLPDVRSIYGRMDEDQTDVEPFSQTTTTLPTRSTSVSSIVKTPTRGLSLVGPVRKRIEKKTRPRIKSRTMALDLKRSDAHKSVKHRAGPVLNASPSLTIETEVESATLRQRLRPMSRKSGDFIPATDEYGTWSQQTRSPKAMKPQHLRHLSADDLQVPSRPGLGLRLVTDVPQTRSARVSPATRRKRSPRIRKPASFSSSPMEVDHANVSCSPDWEEVDHSEELRQALGRALGKVIPDDEDVEDDTTELSVPRIIEPLDSEHVGEIPLPSEVEIRSAPFGKRSPTLMYWGLALSALSDKAYEGFRLLRDTFGTEPAVPQGHVRVRWTCSCGEPLYDDFIEQRPNAARLLEAFLNRPRAHTPRSSTSQSSTASSMASIFDSSSRASTLTTPSSTYGGPNSWIRGSDTSKYSPTRTRTTNSFSVRMPSFAEESWLLTCANEGRLTPKIVHLDVNEGRIRSDKDLALALRDHYDQLNRRWFNWARLRGLTTIEFVQFEIHRNRFADIRAAPSMPPRSATSSSSTSDPEKSQAPSQHPYSFEPNDLLPPVGSTYLLHLFKHPQDYEGELITYLRSPKRRQRLEFGMGWGVHLVEGFLAQRVWAVTMGICGLGSLAFAILWTIKKGDVQGAFGVAQWVLGLAVLLVGGMQAWLE